MFNLVSLFTADDYFIVRPKAWSFIATYNKDIYNASEVIHVQPNVILLVIMILFESLRHWWYNNMDSIVAQFIPLAFCN